MAITKAVIPAAGLGTRFLPATKVVPKELFPIINKPAIQLIVEELVRSGIKEVIFVINEQKQAIKQYFEPDRMLENILSRRQKEDLLALVRKISKLASFRFVYQTKPLGNGHAILCAKEIVGNEPFIANWADDLIIGKNKPYFSQLIEVFQKYHCPVSSVIKTDAYGQKRYGIIDGKPLGKNIWQVKRVVEKPGPETAPSNLASIGGFILTPEIFTYLERTKPGKGGEIWLQDAINPFCQKRKVVALEFEGDYYDLGEPLGFLKTSVLLGLKNKSLAKQFQKFLKQLKM